MKVEKVDGVITLADGSTSRFQIGTDGGWVQWDAVQSRLGDTVEIVEAMARALLDEDQLVSDSDEDDGDG